MAAGDIVPVPGAQFEQTLASASPDMLREMIREFAQRMMDADLEVACNAGYGEVTPDRVNSRNGYRRREWDTRAGTIELAIPKLPSGIVLGCGSFGVTGVCGGVLRAGEASVPMVLMCEVRIAEGKPRWKGMRRESWRPARIWRRGRWPGCWPRWCARWPGRVRRGCRWRSSSGGSWRGSGSWAARCCSTRWMRGRPRRCGWRRWPGRTGCRGRGPGGVPARS